MFRKIANIITVLALLVATTGIIISKHYCGDTLVSVTIDARAESCCGTTCNCCHTDIVSIHLKDNFVNQHISINTEPPAIDCFLSVPAEYLLNNYVPFDEFSQVVFESPPHQDTSDYLSFLQTYRCWISCFKTFLFRFLAWSEDQGMI